MNTNKNKIPRIKKNDTRSEVVRNSISDPDGFRPATKEELLAVDLAKELKDKKGLASYLGFTKKYPEEFLRQILAEVKMTPNNKIKKSRGAMFTYLVYHYAKKLA